ncbi:MAG: hypothetical protein JW894_06840 [Bacteroidales bacterium]|nr:hypothetical protein [Bacteroidales bacterium]
MIKSKLLKLILSIFSIIILSCTNSKGPVNKVKMDLDVRRFEKDLFSIDLYDFEDGVTNLSDKYPEFLPLFTQGIIEIGSPVSDGFADRFKLFFTDFTIYRVSEYIKENFKDISGIEKELENAFGNYSACFPDMQIPKIITCISGFNQSIVTADSILAISLDKYLGSGNEFYELMYPPIPKYMRNKMIPEKIPSDAMNAWIISEFPYNSKKDNLVSQMVFNGRAVYCTKILMPSLPDTLLWGFTSSQLDFCKRNEKGMWEFLIEHKLLFSTDHFIINQYVNDAPFTKDFSNESPGRAVNWIGYQIVSSYMNNNKDITLPDLMKESNYLNILNHSRYNP